MKAWVAAILLLCIPLVVFGSDHDRWDVSAGFGYEFISQEYFLDSLTAEGADSLAATVQLRTDYLDDIKGFLRLEFRPWSDRRLEFRAQYDQTRELARAKLYADSRLDLGGSILRLNNEWELRSRYSGDPEAGDEYLYGMLRFRLDNRLSPSLTQWLGLQGSFVKFDSTAGFTYDYYRIEGRAGLSVTFEDFSYLSAHLFAGTRQVTDSTRLNYSTFGLDAAAFLFYDAGDLDLNLRLERKDYNQPAGASDFTRVELNGRNNVSLGSGALFRQELEVEFTGFSDSDFVNNDAFRGEIIALGGVTAGDWTLLAGPELGFLWEQQSEFLGRSDYVEIGLQAAIDFVNFRSVLLSLESTSGRRNLTFENDLDLQSDFWYERLWLVGDWAIVDGVSLNALFSAEWEWHSREQENSRLFLLSTNLTYSF